jgi:hypothetical protein
VNWFSQLRARWRLYFALQRALDAIDVGRTGHPTDVAIKLRDRGVRGFRQTAISCPVARYLNEELEGETRAYVTSTDVKVVRTFPGGVSVEAQTMLFGTRPAIVRFIRRFDMGSYDYLRA